MTCSRPCHRGEGEGVSLEGVKSSGTGDPDHAPRAFVRGAGGRLTGDDGERRDVGGDDGVSAHDGTAPNAHVGHDHPSPDPGIGIDGDGPLDTGANGRMRESLGCDEVTKWRAARC
jgi:hypothetical protein